MLWMLPFFFYAESYSSNESLNVKLFQSSTQGTLSFYALPLGNIFNIYGFYAYDLKIYISKRD